MEDIVSVEHLLSQLPNCPNALCLMHGVEKFPKEKKCPKVLKVLKSAGPVNYNYPAVVIDFLGL